MVVLALVVLAVALVHLAVLRIPGDVPGVLPDGDVAIMMVEAESTEATWNLVLSGHTAPTEEVVGAGLDASKPFIKALCDAQAELAAQFPK